MILSRSRSLRSPTWFTAQEALESNFIDAIDTKLEMAASLTDMAAIASKAEVTLPVEKIVASLSEQHKRESVTLNAELTAANDQLAENATLIVSLKEAIGDHEQNISDLQNENESHKAKITEMESSHQIALEEAKAINDQAVADKAAEIVGAQTQSAVVEDDAGADGKTDDLLAQYNKLTDHKERAKFRKDHAAELQKLTRKN